MLLSELEAALSQVQAGLLVGGLGGGGCGSPSPSVRASLGRAWETGGRGVGSAAGRISRGSSGGSLRGSREGIEGLEDGGMGLQGGGEGVAGADTSAVEHGFGRDAVGAGGGGGSEEDAMAKVLRALAEEVEDADRALRSAAGSG